MRVTSSMYYNSLYGSNHNKLNQELFDVNKQIASGLSIQYAGDNIATFTDTMRLDNELTSLAQIKKSVESGNKVSTQTDDVLNEFTDSMTRFRTLLVNAANGTHDETSLDAIAKELRGIGEHLKTLSNTSVNGQYLFSGSALDVKPISDDGTYNGNDISMNSFAGSHTQQRYNIPGSELFLGEEKLVHREIVSNVVQKDVSGNAIDGNTTMEELMGTIPAGNSHNFYLRGTKSDGTAFNEKIALDSSVDVNALLKSIGDAYGNTGAIKVVNVSINGEGNITVSDKLNNSSKLDFHLVGASDFGGSDESNVTQILDLETNGGSTDYATALGSASQLFIREFNKSGFDSATGSTIDGLVYDRTMFQVDGNLVSSNVSQILKDDNGFATASTKLVEVASGDTLDGKQMSISGTDVFGNAINVQVDLATSGSTFSLDGGATNYSIFNMNSGARVAVDADEMTYQQLMDVVNMALTGNAPSANTEADYDDAIASADVQGDTYLTHDGKIAFSDLQFITTKATMALHDSNSGSFNAGEASVLTFNTNNSLSISDPKTNFFETVEMMIQSVEEYKNYPDSSSGNERTVGIQGAIAMLDDLHDHVLRIHSTVGAQSNALESSLERTSLLELSTMSLRSSILDTDLAEASLELTQLTLNYEAMLSTVGKVSQLSLVNYL